jgi:sialic acid synthase SpsE
MFEFEDTKCCISVTDVNATEKRALDEIVRLMKVVILDAFLALPADRSTVDSLCESLENVEIAVGDNESELSTKREDLDSVKPNKFFIAKGFRFGETFFRFKRSTFRPDDIESLKLVSEELAKRKK